METTGMRIAIMLALASAATPAFAADQFDLACTGQRQWAVGGAAEPVAARYHIDLVAGRWCRDDCFETLSLAAASADRLLFRSKPKAPGQDESYEEAVGRTGTDWVDLYQGPYPPGDYWSIVGQCTEEPFTGLKKAG